MNLLNIDGLVELLKDAGVPEIKLKELEITREQILQDASTEVWLKIESIQEKWKMTSDDEVEKIEVFRQQLEKLDEALAQIEFSIIGY